MPGRPPWSQSGTEGGGQTVAVSNRPEVEKADVTPSSDVAAGNKYIAEIYAPTGSFYEILGLTASANPDGAAASGDHRFRLKDVASWTQLEFESDYTSVLEYQNGHIRTANMTKQPPTAAAQQQKVRSLRATTNTPLEIEYRNNTDLASTVGIIRLSIQEESY